MEKFQTSGLRIDGRREHQVRKIVCSLGVVDNFDGSALLCQGLTKVLATVSGPREAASRSDAKHDRAIVRCTVSQAAFSTTERRRRRAGDKRSQGISTFVEDTFSNVIQTKLFRKSQIDITLHVLQAEGSVLSACINATSLALVHADGSILLDLNHREENFDGPELSLTLLPKSSRILSMKMGSSSSRVNSALLDQLMEEAQIGCHQINKVFVAKVREYVTEKSTEPQ